MSFEMHQNLAMRSTMVGIPQQIASTHYGEEPEPFIFEPDQEKETLENAGPKQQRQLKSSSHAQAKGESRNQAVNSKQASEEQVPGTEQRPGSLIDTSNMINIGFQSKLRNSPQNPPFQETKTSRTQFVNNMRKIVDLEYKQFVRNPDNCYSKGNLRAILHSMEPKEKDPDTAGAGKAYNLQNISRATSTLNFLQDDFIQPFGDSHYL